MAPIPQPSPPAPPQPPRRRAGPPPGLKNLGNTCYLNSVLQCLAATPPLAAFCFSSRHSSLCKKVFPTREKECAFCLLERQIARLLRLDAGPLETPGKLLRCLSLFAEHFRWGRQEDAHEFLRYAIDTCHTVGLRLRKRVPPPNAGAEEGPGPSTVMTEIFGGKLLSQVKCLACKGESNKTDEIMDISLDLLGSSSVGDALARFFQPEVLDGANKYCCGRCKKLTAARKQMFILRAPNVLVIQLKRFEGIHGGKINRSIEFKEALVLSEFMYKGSQDSQPAYNLFGSIVHSGFSPESGHYYAYIKDASGRWYCCNDAHVSLSSSQEVLSEKVYILFYRLSTQTPKTSTNGYTCSALKSSGTNGIGTSTNLKSSEPSKAALVKQNGSCSSKNNNTSVMLKNGKIAPSPQFKPIRLKSAETEKITSNSKDNFEVRNNAAVNKHVASVESNSGCKDEESAKPSSRNANGNISSDKLEFNPQSTLSAANGNGCPMHFQELPGSNGTKAAESYSEQPSLENGRSSVLHSEESESSLKEVVSSKAESVCKKHSLDEEKFKEMLAERVSSELRSSGWADDVYEFMRSKKRRCIEEAGRCPDSDLIRKQLITDSGRAFRSKIPESLREHLIECLRSYYQEKILLDT